MGTVQQDLRAAVIALIPFNRPVEARPVDWHNLFSKGNLRVSTGGRIQRRTTKRDQKESYSSAGWPWHHRQLLWKSGR
jgi:hypothetical protein